MILVMLLSRTWNTRTAAVVLLGAVVCAAAIKVSPMYANQSAHQGVLQQKQLEADQMIQTAEKQYHTTVKQSPGTVSDTAVQRIPRRDGGSVRHAACDADV